MDSYTIFDVGSKNIKSTTLFIPKDSKDKTNFELIGHIETANGLTAEEIISKNKLGDSILNSVNELEEFSSNRVIKTLTLYSNLKIKTKISKVKIKSNLNQTTFISESYLDDFEKNIIKKIEKENSMLKVSYFKINSIIVDGEEVLFDFNDLEVRGEIIIEYFAILAPKNFLLNLKESILYNVQNTTLFPNLIANGNLLTEEQKKDGSIVIDIGYEITNITIYKNFKLINAFPIDFGGNSITEIIALNKRVSMMEAEKIKKSLSTDEPLLNKKETDAINKKIKKMIKDLIFKKISENVDDMKFPGGVLLIGGGSLYKDIEKLIKSELKLYTFFITTGDMNEKTNSPKQIWQPAQSAIELVVEDNDMLNKNKKNFISLDAVKDFFVNIIYYFK